MISPLLFSSISLHILIAYQQKRSKPDLNAKIELTTAENAHAIATEQEFMKIPTWFGEPGRDALQAENWIKRVE